MVVGGSEPFRVGGVGRPRLPQDDGECAVHGGEHEWEELLAVCFGAVVEGEVVNDLTRGRDVIPPCRLTVSHCKWSEVVGGGRGDGKRWKEPGGKLGQIATEQGSACSWPEPESGALPFLLERSSGCCR